MVAYEGSKRSLATMRRLWVRAERESEAVRHAETARRDTLNDLAVAIQQCRLEGWTYETLGSEFGVTRQRIEQKARPVKKKEPN